MSCNLLASEVMLMQSEIALSVEAQARHSSLGPLMSKKSDTERWLKLAAEARAKAKRMRTSYARVFLLEEAAKYEQLARQAACGGREPRTSIPKPFKR